MPSILKEKTHCLAADNIVFIKAKRKNRNVFPFVSKPALQPAVCQHSQEIIRKANLFLKVKNLKKI